jgi:hypothetical protein
MGSGHARLYKKKGGQTRSQFAVSTAAFLKSMESILTIWRSNRSAIAMSRTSRRIALLFNVPTHEITTRAKYRRSVTKQTDFETKQKSYCRESKRLGMKFTNGTYQSPIAICHSCKM